ncbi:hypothetical protein CISG_03696 [Coccidioides immitis RMSCC 3703]|uniref:Uncharacterized protein n=2 Tax=Coccidioides immitis TaxID=5501 RepID=A0A0J8QMH0_COCIT|nr:hypothetical protein CIRG_06348 [Coccidioides immitis RMSCC 2394]KMU73646.1 hypothetical protein CISG_03696 [Coccidioides immitis RMSCC 3703]
MTLLSTKWQPEKHTAPLPLRYQSLTSSVLPGYAGKTVELNTRRYQ